MIRPQVKFTVLLLTLAALTGCDLDGTLHVQQSATLIDKKGRQVPIEAGRSYRSELGQDGDKVKLNIEINGKEKEIRLALPRGTKLPKYAGELTILGSQTGQPVDFHGVVDTKDYDGSDQRGSQSCNTIAQIRVCSQVPVTSRDGRPTNEERCSFESRSVTGNQDIEFHDRQTVTSAVAQLLLPNSQTVVANLDGSRSSSQRIVTWTGRCMTPYDDGPPRGPGGPGPGGWPPPRPPRR